MGEEQRSERATARYERWVALWVAGVRASGPAMAIGDPTTARIIELSPALARLVGDVPKYLDMVEPRDASDEMLRLMRAGLIEGARARRRLRRVDGSLVDVHAIGWVVRCPDGPDLGLGMWIPDPGASAEDNGHEDVLNAAFPKQDHPHPAGDRVLVDESWRILEMQTSGDRVIGWTRQEMIQSSVLERTHPDDVPALLFALARATTDSGARALVRVRHRDGTWRGLEIAPTVVSNHVSAVVALVLVAGAEPAAGPPEPSITAIPNELRRIADHIETAELMAPLAEVADGLDLAPTDLSPRQWEVVNRLVRGERVSTIATEMYLSRSTIRNHLTAIYAKVGVHSQEELVGLYRRHRDHPS